MNGDSPIVFDLDLVPISAWARMLDWVKETNTTLYQEYVKGNGSTLSFTNSDEAVLFILTFPGYIYIIK